MVALSFRTMTVPVLLLVAALAAGPVRADEPMRLPVDAAALDVIGADGETKARFDLEIARTGAERARGLMHRTDLPEDRAMLFVFDAEAPRSFWMQNTPTSLDIIFADGAGTIVRVAERTVPSSTTPIRSGAPAQYVLEVHAGTAERLGIAAGDRLVHPAIGAP